MATTGQKLLAAGPTLAAAEIGFAMAHTGFIGAVVAAGIAAVVYVTVEETMSGENENSSPDDSQEADASATQQADPITEKTPSLLYRLFNGKSAREAYNVDTNESNEQSSTPNAKDKDSETKANNVVDLAKDLQIEVDEIAGKATYFVGMRRSGKTTLGTRVAEQLGRKFKIPMYIPDLEGDWLSTSDILPRCVIAGHPSAFDPQASYMYCPISTIKEAQLLGYDILESGLQVILDMGSYDSVDDACNMSVNIIKGIFAWTKQHPAELCPCDIYLDEAQRFLPENLGESIIQDEAVLKAMLKVYMDITAVGGKRGLAPKILSQRFAQTNKKIIGQTEVFFIMRQTNDGDLEKCMKYVKKSTTTPEQIAKFVPGQGVYVGADGTQLVTHFKPRQSDGNRSRTPKAAAAMRYADKEPYTGPTMSTKSRITEEQGEGTLQQKDVAPLPQPIIPEKDNRPKASDIDLAEAIEAYNNGATNRRKLADKFGMSETQGANLLKRIEEARTLA
ncbi:MAG: hypothetical protein H0V70_24175 [Ktedonobacteraceae bacterium]|nr:hypothetical protein [Ktedonobacteraceae bacterium]